jgi:hypothetical protein
MCCTIQADSKRGAMFWTAPRKTAQHHIHYIGQTRQRDGSFSRYTQQLPDTKLDQRTFCPDVMMLRASEKLKIPQRVDRSDIECMEKDDMDFWETIMIGICYDQSNHVKGGGELDSGQPEEVRDQMQMVARPVQSVTSNQVIPSHDSRLAATAYAAGARSLDFACQNQRGVPTEDWTEACSQSIIQLAGASRSSLTTVRRSLVLIVSNSLSTRKGPLRAQLGGSASARYLDILDHMFTLLMTR